MYHRVYVFLLLGLSYSSSVIGLKSSEQQTWDYINKGGDVGYFIPQTKNGPINIKIGLTLVRMSDYSDSFGGIEITYWLQQIWDIPEMKWDPKQKNTKLLHVDVSKEKIWLPDIVPYVIASPVKPTFPARVVIRSNGTVMYVPSFIIKVPCENVPGSSYPRDTKVCRIKFGSWVYSDHYVNLTLASTTPDVLVERDLGDWKFVNATGSFEVQHYPCCPEGYPAITYEITIERSDQYFGLVLSLPGIAIGLIVALLYLLPPSSAGRVISQMVCLLILVYLGVKNLQRIGKVLAVPAAGYMMAAMVLDLIAIVWSILAAVLWMQHSNRRSEQGCMDSFLSKLSCICCLPSMNSGTQTEDDHSKSEQSGQQCFGLSAVQRFCLVLDRLFCLINIVLFVVMFLCLGI